MDNPRIKIESDGNTATIYIDGEKVKGKMVDLHFHGDVDDGIHIAWDYEIIKEDENGMPLVENNEIVTEKHHFDNRGA